MPVIMELLTLCRRYHFEKDLHNASCLLAELYIYFEMTVEAEETMSAVLTPVARIE